MSERAEWVGFDRVTYRDGQRLVASDLEEVRLRMAALGWLHSRALHGEWGIVMGLEVDRIVGGGLRLRPGIALDRHGRELILADALVPPLPGGAGALDRVLSLSYREDREYPGGRCLATCVGGGLDPSAERPRLVWRTLDEVRFGPEVPLARVRIVDGAVEGEPDPRVRRYAARRVRPHIGTGSTEEGRTGWRRWPESGPVLGIEAEVDTGEAGFVRQAYYFATLESDLTRRPDEAVPLFPGVPWLEASFFAEAFVSVTAATPSGFLFRLVDPARLGLFGTGDDVSLDRDLVLEAESRGWRVHWIGLEPAAGCEPLLRRTFTLSGFAVLARLPSIAAREGSES